VLGNTDEALEYYLNAITKEPNNVEFLKNRSQCYFDLKMYEESAQDLDKALAQNQCDA
jgi:tetratricopeptide (TPR) repeat protein